MNQFSSKIAKATPWIQLLSGVKMPQVGLGTSGISGNRMTEILKYAIRDCGYRGIDTAIMYQNQTDIGKGLKEMILNKEIKRSELYIISKIPPWMQGTQKAKEAMDQILHELQLDYIDLIMIHWPFVEGLEKVEAKHAEIRLQTWNVMEQYKDAGKIKDLAMSNFTIEHIKHLFNNCKHRPSLNQFEIHPLYFDTELIDFCKKNSIVIQAYASLGKGRTNMLEIPTIKRLSEKYQKTPAQICLKWSLQNGYCIIPKSNHEERLKTNIELFDWEISKNDMREINQLNEHKKVLPDPNQILNSFLNLGKPQNK